MLYLFPFRNFHILEVRADRLRKLPMNMELQTFTKFRNMSFCRNFGADIEKYHIIFFSQRDKLFGYRMSIILDRLNTEPWHVQGAFEMCFRIWKWLFGYYYAFAFWGLLHTLDVQCASIYCMSNKSTQSSPFLYSYSLNRNKTSFLWQKVMYNVNICIYLLYLRREGPELKFFAPGKVCKHFVLKSGPDRGGTTWRINFVFLPQCRNIFFNRKINRKLIIEFWSL